MLILSICWLLLGALIGALAHGAKLRPGAPRRTDQDMPPACLSDRWRAHHLRRGWLLMLAIGALAALLGGWLGTLLLGKYIATAVALWVAVLSVVVCWFVIWALGRPQGVPLHGPKSTSP